MIVLRRSLKAVGGNTTVEKTTNFLRMDALENVRLRCAGYRSERSRNGRRVPREGTQFIASPREDGSRGCAGREYSMSKIPSAFFRSGSHLSRSYISLYIQAKKSDRKCRCKWNGNSFWRAEIPEILEIPKKSWFVDNATAITRESFLQWKESLQVSSYYWNYYHQIRNCE